MPIIFFVGRGVTPKSVRLQYKEDDRQYIKNNFVEMLEKIDEVIIPNIPYHHVYYYQKNDINGWKERYDVINKLSMNDITIEKFIENLDLIKERRKKKFILLGHSDGIYFAMEFARQYPEKVNYIISLDGSWISKDLCEQRLENWKKQGKHVKVIENQDSLDYLVNKVKTEEDNNKFIKQILDHTRLEHTVKCINYNYQDIIKHINYVVFRDFNGTIKDDIDKQFNEYAIKEHDILSKISKKYRMRWLVNATHDLWFNELYKQQIIEQIYAIINCKQKEEQDGGYYDKHDYYQKYMKYKKKYLELKDLQKGGNKNGNKNGNNYENKFIIHISGPSGAGKTTLGNKLKKKFGDKIVVQDIDDLHEKFITQYGKKSGEHTVDFDTKLYQEYIDAFIVKQKKPIIFVGLNDAPLRHEKLYYDMHSQYNYYIDIDDTVVIKQKCLRLLSELPKNKFLMNDLVHNNKKFIELIKQAIDFDCNEENILKNNDRWRKDYKNQSYKFMSRNKIFDAVSKIIQNKEE